MTRRPFRALPPDEGGASIVEFALILTPLMMLLLGLVDLGFQQYIAFQLQGALDQAARQVTVGGVSQDQVQTLVQDRIHSILSNAVVKVTPKSFDNFSHVSKAEPLTTDANGNNVLDKGDCYLDVNGNGQRDMDVKSGTSGTGGGDDIVFYTATVTYPELMPMFGLMGWPNPTVVTGNMMMRNQPYAAQLQPPTVCI